MKFGVKQLELASYEILPSICNEKEPMKSQKSLKLFH